MHVPHSGRALRGLGDVPFDEDGAGGGAFGREDEVAHFDGAGVARLADLEHGGRFGLVGKGGAGRHEEGPDLAGDFDVGGDFDGVGDDVGAVVKVDDLRGGGGEEDGLDGGGVVGVPVTFGAVGLDAEEG